MKSIKIFLIFSFVISANAQISTESPSEYISLINFDAINKIIDDQVKYDYEVWEQKGQSETSTEYAIRVNWQSKLEQKQLFKRQITNELLAKNIQLKIVFKDYIIENETFSIDFYNVLPINIHVQVSGNEAEDFDRNIQNIEFRDPSYIITSNNQIAIEFVEILNPANNKIYSYNRYSDFAYSKNEELPFNKAKIETFRSDIDINIPISNSKNENVYALLIGNEDYTKYQTNLTRESNVKYAIKDAETFAEYVEKTLGVPNENITILRNAISSQMKRELERFINKAKYSNGEKELIFYYSGHGFPDLETKESYIMPVDISGSFIKDGVKLSDLYKNLSLYQTKRITVILDACFSGGGREQGLLAAKGVKIKPKENLITKGKIVVFSASSGEQESLFYDRQQHGLFTYYFLKKIQETKGEISYRDLANYLSIQIPLKATDTQYREQNPQINVSFEAKDVWQDWRFIQIK